MFNIVVLSVGIFRNCVVGHECFLNAELFPSNTIKVIREFERIQKKICRHKMSIMFNEIYIYIYISLITWPFLDRMFSNFNSMFRNSSKFHVQCFFFFSGIEISFTGKEWRFLKFPVYHKWHQVFETPTVCIIDKYILWSRSSSSQMTTPWWIQST